MNPENKKFLDDNRHHWDTLTKAFYLKHLDGNTRSRFQQIIRDEFNPGYSTDLWCPPCVADLVRLVYRLYDDRMAHEAKLAAEQAKTETPVREQEKIDFDIKTDIEMAATFPITIKSGSQVDIEPPFVFPDGVTKPIDVSERKLKNYRRK